MHNQKFVRVSAALLLGGLMAGCGGGGGSSTPTLAAKTRALQPGDQWVYSVTGKATDPTSPPLTLNGTLTLALSAASEQTGGGSPPLMLNGKQVLQLQSTLTGTVTITGSAPQTINTVSNTFLTQDATTGDILEVGDDGSGGTNTIIPGGTFGSGGVATSTGGTTSLGGGVGTPSIVRMVTPPAVIIPGTWVNNLAENGVLHFDTGDTQSYALNVLGTETVQTPAGRFSAWKTNEGTASGVTVDWAPQLGMPVRLALQISSPATGSSATGSATATALLKSTTVAH